MAESEGFEPPDLLQSTVFKTAAFDRSANSPVDLTWLGLVNYSQARTVLSAGITGMHRLCQRSPDMVWPGSNCHLSPVNLTCNLYHFRQAPVAHFLIETEFQTGNG